MVMEQGCNQRPSSSVRTRPAQLIRTVNQGEIADGAIPVATVVKREVIARSAESTDLRITSNNHVKGRSDAGDTSPEVGPAGAHMPSDHFDSSIILDPGSLTSTLVVVPGRGGSGSSSRMRQYERRELLHTHRWRWRQQLRQNPLQHPHKPPPQGA